jgi:hypothetical protein
MAVYDALDLGFGMTVAWVRFWWGGMGACIMSILMTVIYNKCGALGLWPWCAA